jgi:glycosyltransferase involved in cell wall biosynthesis
MIEAFVSVIVPYFNSVDTLKRAIDSLSNQSDSDWELIIVDDGSDLELGSFISGFDSQKVKFFRKNNSGPSDSRNFGVAKASGKFVGFLDCDDWLDSEWVKRFKSSYEFSNYDVAYCFGAIIDEETKVKVNWDKYTTMSFNGQQIKFNNLVGTFLIKKNLFEHIQGFDTKLRYSENMDLAIRILQGFETLKLEYIEEVLVYFGNSLNSKTRNSKYGRALMAKDLNYFQNKHSKFLNENINIIRGLLRKQIASSTICFYFGNYIRKLYLLYSFSFKDGIKYTFLFFIFPFYYLRLRSQGFRK